MAVSDVVRPARVRAATFDRRVREWVSLRLTGYQGFRVCSRCGSLAHCRGRRYEGQRCRDCYLRGL